MARVSRKAVVIPVETEDENEPTREEQESRDIADRALSSVPATTTAKLFRVDPTTGREGYLATIDASAFSIEYVKEQFGGGDYRVELRGPTGKGRIKGYKGGDTFTVDKAIPPKYPRVADTSGNGAPVYSPNAGGGSALDAAVATMLTSMISQQQTASQQQAESTRAMNLMMMTMMKDHSAMLATQLQALARPAADPLEQAERLTKILQPPKTGGFTEFLRDYAAFKELTDGGDGGGGEHWAAQIAKAVASHLLRSQPEPEPAPVPMTGPVANGPVPSSSRDSRLPPSAEIPHEVGERAETPEPIVPNDLVPLAGLLPKLRSARALGLSPELIAQAILDGTDDDDTLEALLTRPGLVADIHKAAPELPVGWLDDIRRLTLDALRESVEEGEPDDDRGRNGAPAPAGG